MTAAGTNGKKRRAVVLVGEPTDAHIVAVSEAAQRLGALVRVLSMRDFPGAAQASYRQDPAGSGEVLYFTPRTLGEEIPWPDVVSVWWRRPERCTPPRVFTGRDRGEFVQAESDHFLQGLMWSTRCLWVNDPTRELFASRKVVQLRRAAECGLCVPRTLITNRPDEARAFIRESRGKVVFKRVGTTPGPASKTTFVTDEVLESLPAIATCPTTFQEYIAGKGDVRIVWVDGQALSVFIDSQAGSSAEDCRFDLTVKHEACSVPPNVKRNLDRLMADLGLAFGAVDFRIGPLGEFVFLEVNPAGQFLYLERRAGVPIANALATLLMRGRQVSCPG